MSGQGQIAGHGAGIPPGPGAASHLSHLPFAPGKPQHLVPGVGRDLELWPLSTTARSLPGSPLLHSRSGGRELNPKFGWLPPSWPCFPWLRRLGAGGGGECQQCPLDTGPRQQLPSTGGCHSATEQPGTGAPNPPCAPLLGRQCLRAGGSASDTVVAAGSAPGSVSERGWGLVLGLSPVRCWGAGGRGRAGAGPCPPALRHRCSPNTPDLKRRFQPGAGGRGPVPPAPVTHSPGAWHPGRAPAPPPRLDAGRMLARPAAPHNGAGRAPQPSPLNNRVLSRLRPPRRRGQRIPARGPRSGPAALGVPTQPPAIPGPRRGHGATPIRVVPRAGPGAKAGAGVGAGGATVQETHRKLLGAAPEINGGRRIRGVSCGGRSSMSHGGEEGSGTR